MEWSDVEAEVGGVAGHGGVVGLYPRCLSICRRHVPCWDKSGWDFLLHIKWFACSRILELDMALK